MFSLPSKLKHAGVGRNATSVELERKNLADLHCKFLRLHHTKKASSTVKKYYRPAFVKELAQCRRKNSSRGYLTTYVGCCFDYSIPE